MSRKPEETLPAHEPHDPGQGHPGTMAAPHVDKTHIAGGPEATVAPHAATVNEIDPNATLAPPTLASHPDPEHAPPTLMGQTQLQSTLSAEEPWVVEQRNRWLMGERVPVEAFVRLHASLSTKAQNVLSLIYTEISLRQGLGERPTCEEYVNRFPHFEHQLRTHFEHASPSTVDQAAVPTRALDARPTPQIMPHGMATAAPRSMQDYLIEATLGRGGMGVVYKAFQRSLNRYVALKMILGGLHAGSEELTRFRLEAEASARLQHPNIVQIYEIGEEDGRPFFCLEYIDGGSLAQKLDGTPQNPRSTAHLVEQLARAMHHAHERGVVHRDLKPGNILLAKPAPGATADSYGVPKITDFGLAKRLDVDQGQTNTGAILGTPSYMAPEQASGNTKSVGPGADIFALGAILYDMLTGRPPFKGSTLADTLQMVQDADPVAVVRLQPKTPRDLETICLKCLQKEPEKRYSSAQALADDLRRFLNGEPVQARPTPIWERGWKWAKRRPALAALYGVSAAAVLLLMVGGWIYSLDRARAADSERNLKNQAQTNYLKAEENFQRALGAVRQMLTRVGAVDLVDVPQLEPIRRALLQEAKQYYVAFLQERSSDPQIRREAAEAYRTLGEIQDMLGDLDAAEQSNQSAIQLLQELQEEDSGEVAVRRALARCLQQQGLLLKRRNQLPEARQELEKALALRLDAQGSSADKADLAGSYYHLATILARQPKKGQEAEQNYQQARQLQTELTADASLKPEDRLEAKRALARTLNNLAIFQQSISRVNEALQDSQQAVKLQRELVQQNPDVSTYQRELARSESTLAVLRERAGERLESQKEFQQAIDRLKRLATDFPRVPTYRDEMAVAQHTRGEILWDTGRADDAQAAFEQALVTRQTLVKDYPRIPEFQQKLADVYQSLGDVYMMARPYKAAHYFQLALEQRRQLVANYPNAPTYQSDLGSTLNNLAYLLFNAPPALRLGTQMQLLLSGSDVPKLLCMSEASNTRLEQARELLVEASRLQQNALAAEPRNGKVRNMLRNHYILLAQVQLGLGNADGVEIAARHLPELYPQDHLQYVTAAEFLALCLPRIQQDMRLDEAQRKEKLEAFSGRVLQLLADGVKRGYQDLNYLEKSAVYGSLRQRPEFQRLLEDLRRRTEKAVTQLLGRIDIQDDALRLSKVDDNRLFGRVGA